MTGRQGFIDALRRALKPRKDPGLPKPTDAWGAWVDYRLQQLEGQQTWLLRLLLGALVIQVGLKVLDLLK